MQMQREREHRLTTEKTECLILLGGSSMSTGVLQIHRNTAVPNRNEKQPSPEPIRPFSHPSAPLPFQYPLYSNRLIEIKSSHWVILSLQSLQSLQPPLLVPVHFLLAFLAESVVHVSVQSAPWLARLHQVADLARPAYGQCVKRGVRAVHG